MKYTAALLALASSASAFAPAAKSVSRNHWMMVDDGSSSMTEWIFICIWLKLSVAITAVFLSTWFLYDY